MDRLVDVAGGFGVIGISVAILLFGVFVILIPFCAYSAQKWAYKCYLELRVINERQEHESQKRTIPSVAGQSNPGIKGSSRVDSA